MPYAVSIETLRIEEAGRFEQLCVLECFGFKQQMPIKGQTSVRCLLSGELPESGF